MNKNVIKIFSVFSFLFVFLFFAGCHVTNTSKKINRLQHLEEGVGSPTTMEDLEDAIKKYNERVEDLCSANAQIGIWHKMVANRYLEKKMYGEALKSFQKAIEFYPQNQNLYYWVGVCAGYTAKSSLDYSGTGNFSQKQNYYKLAESAYLSAIQIEPTFVRPMYGISVLYAMELNEPEKAIPYLERLLTIDTKNSDAMLLLARCYYATYENEKAVDMYDKIIKVSKSQKAKDSAEENKKIILDSLYGEN
ncbi:MAG: tetratricopeptide repeat protein [Treponemataceae bacterium]